MSRCILQFSGQESSSDMLVLFLDLTCFVCALLYLRSWLSHWRKRNLDRLPYPPGPRGLPLVGSIFDMYGVEEWEKARRYGEKHGDLILVENLGRKYIFVNSYDVAVELFDRRGHNYSSRPQNTLIELEGWTRLTVMMPYGDELRKSRQMLHRFLAQSVVADFNELHVQATHRLLLNLLKEPESFLDLTRRAAGEVIMMATYGYKVLDGNDPYIDLAERGVKVATEAEGFFVINMIPWLRHLPEWIPGTGFHKIIREGYKLTQEMVYAPYEMTKKSILDGTAMPSITSKLIEANSTEDGKIKDEKTIASSTAVTYAAGADTTVSAINTFFLAMVLHPDVQRRAHEELDRVIGKDSLPTVEDESNLPYINAVCCETLRWQTVTPFGVAHCAEEDDVYNGYFIPAGTAVLSNIWAMHRDPRVYPEPEKFSPERWLPSEGKTLPLDIRKTAFGFGRRTCPGRHFAYSSIFLAVASTLAAFKIEKAVDENGVPITPPVEYAESFLRHVKPFKCIIIPRSDKIASTVQQAVDSAK
ncbi:hypothetical protein M0805_000830 [Coniferiporia weirii]|nr:hypothetical protein M0805_000830 [Coniferiporia weirii]